MSALPVFMVSPNVNYVPLVLLIIAGSLWIIKHLRKDPPAPQPLIKEETGFTPSGGGLFTPTVTQSEPRPTPELNELIPILKRRYVSRKPPPPGTLLPEVWLKEEVAHLNTQLQKAELDESEIENLKLPLAKDSRIIESPQALSDFQGLVATVWGRAQQEFTNAMDSVRTLTSIWYSFRPGVPSNMVRLPGSQGNILLTLDILTNIQAQTKTANK